MKKKKLRETIPIRTKHRRSLPPWVTSETSNLLKRLESTPQKYDANHPKCLALSIFCQRSLQKDKIEHGKRLADDKNTNVLFKFDRSLNKPLLPSTLLFSFAQGSTDLEKAEFFANFFTENYIESSQYQINRHSISNCPILDDFIVDESLIMDTCSNVDIKKASVPVYLPPFLFSKCAITICRSLYQLFYKIKQSSTYPKHGTLQ